MSQLSRSLLVVTEDTLDQVINESQEQLLRERKRIQHSREQRRDVRRSPKQCVLSSTAAPGVDLREHMGKTWFRDMRNVIWA